MIVLSTCRHLISSRSCSCCSASLKDFSLDTEILHAICALTAQQNKSSSLFVYIAYSDTYSSCVNSCFASSFTLGEAFGWLRQESNINNSYSVVSGTYSYTEFYTCSSNSQVLESLVQVAILHHSHYKLWQNIMSIHVYHKMWLWEVYVHAYTCMCVFVCKYTCMQSYNIQHILRILNIGDCIWWKAVFGPL